MIYAKFDRNKVVGSPTARHSCFKFTLALLATLTYGNTEIHFYYVCIYIYLAVKNGTDVLTNIDSSNVYIIGLFYSVGF